MEMFGLCLVVLSFRVRFRFSFADYETDVCDARNLASVTKIR